MLKNYFLHLSFEGVAAVGGYYARAFCPHRWHRVTVAVVWSMVTTLILVNAIG
jgi:hypothetical protein